MEIMASFGILPNELLEPVVARLLDRKIDDLDIVATRDLQNARLVCRTVCDLPVSPSGITRM